MNRKDLVLKLQAMAEDEIPSGSINLWKKIEKNLVQEKQKDLSLNGTLTNQGKTSLRKLSISVLIGATTFLLMAFLVFTPQGKVFAQAILQFFTRSEQNAKALPIIETELVAPANQAQPFEESVNELPSLCGTILVPECTLNQVQEQVDFPIQSPSTLLESFELAGSVPIQDGVLMKYEGLQGIILLAEVQTDQKKVEPWLVGKDANIESIFVGSNPAEYSQGAWVGLGLDEENEIPWDPQMPTRVLRWQADELMFTLVNFPASTAKGPNGLDQTQMVILAESLSSNAPDSAGPANETGTSLENAEKMAGFDFVEPVWMPGGFKHEKTIFNSQHNAICQAFSYGKNNTQPSLVITQSSWALPTLEQIQSKAYFDGKPVVIGMTEQSVSMKGASNNKALFVETGLDVDAFCGDSFGSANRALLWQKGNQTFIIFGQLDANDGRGFITAREMVLLAESLDGFGPDPTATNILDGERLSSKTDAESLTGMKIKFPSLMLSNVLFDHIAYREQESGNPIISAIFKGEPLGDGRHFLVNIFQTPDSENTLENLMLAGGFSPMSVNKDPGIYQSQCWDSTLLAGGVECQQTLTWFEGGTQFDIFTYFPAEVSKEQILSIAESME